MDISENSFTKRIVKHLNRLLFREVVEAPALEGFNQWVDVTLGDIA